MTHHGRSRQWATFVLVLFLVSACAGSEQAVLEGYERDVEPNVGAIALHAANREPERFEFRAEPGKLLMVNFGFTFCPDICPTTLSDTRLAFVELGARAEDVDFAFVTVDPERDSAGVLTSYVEAFLDDGIALRTDDPTELAIAADAFGVSYFIEEEDGEPVVAHTPNVFVVDDQGSLILTWPFGVPTSSIVSDLTILLDRTA